MPGKEKEGGEKTHVLKGAAAEKKVLDYVKEAMRIILIYTHSFLTTMQMNRPFGAADIFANLKGAVAKASVQKILVALAEKGEITQKAYAKTLIFVANQAGLDEMPVEKVEALEAEEKKFVEENTILSSELKSLTQELALLRSTPTNDELGRVTRETEEMLLTLQKQLVPLRSGAPLVSPEEIAQLDVEWQKWRSQWTLRRKVFLTLHSLATDAMGPQESRDFAEDLGIEYDTPEHAALENSALCKLLAKPRR